MNKKFLMFLLCCCLSVVSGNCFESAKNEFDGYESNSYVAKAKRLLEWNKEKLTSRSDLKIKDIEELFAPEFVVMANGRKYDANYQNYYEFLNKFRSDIDTIDYEVQEYLNMGPAVVMPLKATVKRTQGNVDVFDVIMLVKFNNLGKIVHWQEVYSKR